MTIKQRAISQQTSIMRHVKCPTQPRMPLRSALLRGVFLLWLLAGTAAAQSPRISAPAALSFDVWPVEDGLQQNAITAIVQSRAGYLWLGTYHGLARFDGVRFTVFDSSNTP